MLSWEGQGVALDIGAVLIVGACLCWGIDNNLTRKLSSADPIIIAAVIVAGGVNIGIGFWRNAAFLLVSVGSRRRSAS